MAVTEAWSLSSVGGPAGRTNGMALSFANLGSSAFQSMPGQLELADRCLPLRWLTLTLLPMALQTLAILARYFLPPIPYSLSSPGRDKNDVGNQCDQRLDTAPKLSSSTNPF